MSDMRTACLITEARAIKAAAEGERISVDLVDGRMLFVPVSWSARLSAATPAQRKNIRIVGGGRSLQWHDIDETVDVSCLLG
jgi:hypothetical protein